MPPLPPPHGGAMMRHVGRTLAVLVAVLALAGSAVAAQQPPKRFPALRYGV